MAEEETQKTGALTRLLSLRRPRPEQVVHTRTRTGVDGPEASRQDGSPMTKRSRESRKETARRKNKSARAARRKNR